MNQLGRDQGGPEVVTQESILLDAAERIGRIRDGRMAVHLHLSALKPQNRQMGYLRVAGRMLEPMVNAYRGQIFLLSNGDIVFLLNQPSQLDLREHVHRLRGLFSKDPLIHEEREDGSDPFCSTYDLTFDYEAFLAVARALAAEIRTQKTGPQAEIRSLDARSLSGVLDKLVGMDVTPFVRRQSAISLSGQGLAQVAFQEFFVSMADLQRVLAPDLNLFGNRWMFQHLATALDIKMLDAIQRMRLARAPASIHLNLNLSTLSHPAFTEFEVSHRKETGFGVEVRVLDVLADSRRFFAARAMLKDRGFNLVVDGLDETTLTFMDVSRTEADLYKLDWTPEMQDPARQEALVTALHGIDPDKLVMARCDSETAILWGLDRGIQKFQGRYVEAMLAATTIGICDKAAACACTLAQCTARHGVIAGPLRHECGNNLTLDTPPLMRAPQRKAKK